MKAAVYDKKSAPDVLQMRDADKPSPGDGEVLVKIAAASLNAADYRSMRMGIIPKRGIFGAAIAGTAVAVGRGAGKFAVGEAVCADTSGCGFGGLAEYAAVPENVLARVPPGMPFEVAAAIPLAAVTALQGLRKGGIREGQSVLIYGAGGGVGTFAVQLARHFGAEVTAVCGAHNFETARSLGADHVLDYAKADLAHGDGRYDLILAVNGKNSLRAYRRSLTPAGVYVMVGGAMSQVLGSIALGPFLSLGSRKMRALAAKPGADDLDFVLKLVAEGSVRPVIDRRYPLERANDALRYIQEGHARGKVVIDVERNL